MLEGVYKGDAPPGGFPLPSAGPAHRGSPGGLTGQQQLCQQMDVCHLQQEMGGRIIAGKRRPLSCPPSQNKSKTHVPIKRGARSNHPHPPRGQKH